MNPRGNSPRSRLPQRTLPQEADVASHPGNIRGRTDVLDDDDRIAILGITRSTDKPSEPFYFSFKLTGFPDEVQTLITKAHKSLQLRAWERGNKLRGHDQSLTVAAEEIANLDLDFTEDIDELQEITGLELELDEETAALHDMDGGEREKIDGAQLKLEDALTSEHDRMAEAYKESLMDSLKDFLYEQLDEEEDEAFVSPNQPRSDKTIAMTITFDPAKF
jgi:hypothetical protein